MQVTSKFEQPMGRKERRWEPAGPAEEGDHLLLEAEPGRRAALRGHLEGPDFQSAPPRGDLWGAKVGGECPPLVESG